MRFEVERHDTAVNIDGRTIQLPYAIESWIAKNEGLILLLRSALQKSNQTPDIQFNSNRQNVGQIKPEGSLSWIIESPKSQRSEESSPRYTGLYSLRGRVLAKHSNGEIYEVNSKNGELLNSWPDTSLPIGDTVVSLPGSVDQIVHLDDKIMVRVHTVHPEPDTLAFDADGTLLLRCEERLGNVFHKEGKLRAKKAVGPRTSVEYVINPGTGEIAEKEDVPDYWN